MKIKILSTHVSEKPWNKNGRSGVIRTQEAVAETERFRQTIRLDLGNNDPHPVGDYTVDLERNVIANQFGDLQLARKFILEPFAVAKPAAAPAR